MAVNSVLLKTETSNFQKVLSYLYATEKNTRLWIMVGVGMP